MSQLMLFQYENLTAAVYSFQQLGLYTVPKILSYRQGSLNCILTFAVADDVRPWSGLVDNYHEREI